MRAVTNTVFVRTSSVTSTSTKWQFSLVQRQLVGLDQRSCATLSPVSSGMGDCLRAGKLSHYVTSHPDPDSAFHPSGVGK